MQHVDNHETSRILSNDSVLFSTLKSCPVPAQISLFCNAVRAGQVELVQSIRNAFVHSLLWELSNFMHGKLDPKGAKFVQLFPTLSTLLASKEMEALSKEAPSTLQVGTADNVIVNSISALFAGLYCVVNFKDLRLPWWRPSNRNHAVRRALSSIVNQIARKWDHALQPTVVKNEKKKLEDAVTKYMGPTAGLPLASWRHWQVGLLRVVTPHEADDSLSRGMAVRLMEHDGRRLHLTKYPTILPPKQVMDSLQYRTAQESVEQRQRQSIELSTAIQAARAKATAKTEMDEEL
jgi:hypothetical protein